MQVRTYRLGEFLQDRYCGSPANSACRRTDRVATGPALVQLHFGELQGDFVGAGLAEHSLLQADDSFRVQKAPNQLDVVPGSSHENGQAFAMGAQLKGFLDGQLVFSGNTTPRAPAMQVPP